MSALHREVVMSKTASSHEGFADYFAQTRLAMEDIPASELETLRDGVLSLGKSGATLWVAGNGGSASTASHFVADMVKSSTGFGGVSVRTVALHEQVSLATALANDVSFEEAFAEQLRYLAKPGDLFLYLSVSGTSPNLIRAAEAARGMGLRTACIVGAKGKETAKDLCEIPIIVESTDYQVVENGHIILMHWLCRVLQDA